MIERQVGQMSRLIDDLLDVSRITRGTLELRRERVACADVVEAAIEACREDLAAKGHRLRTDLPPRALEIEADRDRLVQVLCNLLGNAAKYTPPGGHIDLAVGAGDERTLVISVKDDGVGIPSGKLGEIFDLFARVEQALDRQGGLGVGLTLARQLVELHGGTIEPRSPGIGRGSEFVVRLPVIAPLVQPAATVVDVHAAATPLRIVVADDNEDAAESLAALLEMTGHDVHVAFDGEAAVTAIQQIRPDVALLDIGMPKLNGYEVARRIRGDVNAPRTYLVAITGWGQDSDRQRAEDAGFDAHLVKPVPPDVVQRLLATIGRVSASGRLASA
jgi:CheY-like chemotaxis protein